MTPLINLQNAEASTLISYITQPVDLVHADPPWSYNNAVGSGGNAKASRHYDVMSMLHICNDLQAAYGVAADNSYLALWCTLPLLAEWMGQGISKHMIGRFHWQYITAAVWHKTGQLGVGFHVRGDAEICLIYKKGKPKPKAPARSNHWSERNRGHSIKPKVGLKHINEMGTHAGETVLDLYAGASASMAICCRELGRHYMGAEADPVRHKEALTVLSQGDLFAP